MKRYRQILHEVADAAEFVRYGGHVPDVVSEGTDFYASLRDLPDDTVINDYAPELPDLGPASVMVNTIEEFGLVYRALGVVHNFPVDRYTKYRDFTHEEAHLDAVRQWGFRRLGYGILITESAYRSYGWFPFNGYAEPIRPVTKLAIASFTAAPLDLYKGDMYRLHTMGYTGQGDVARRIIAANNPALRIPYIYRS